MANEEALKAADLASSLKQDDIPIKLRCAICNKLAVEAFRLPCCDQSICFSCQTTLSDTCPICDHQPLSAEDCKIDKKLRATVKVFLKSQEKKREKSRAAIQPPVPETPQEQPDTIATDEKAGQDIDSKEPEAVPQDQEPVQETIAGTSHISTEQNNAVAEPSNKEEDESTTQVDQTNNDDAQDDDSKAVEEIPTNNEADASWAGQDQTVAVASLGYNQADDSNDMGWQNGMNPMMQMQFQNAMQSGNWSGFPNAMGMSGMGMNAMNMPQGMFGNFGAPGMGMNGLSDMNMGMGVGGGFGGWNEQSMNDDFNNSGYYPGGYNQQSHQGHYSQMQHQQFSRNNYHNQNRFHGRGAHSHRGYGRGYHRNYRGNHAYSHSQGHYAENGQYEETYPEDTRPYSHDRRTSQGESVVLTNAAADTAESNGQTTEGADQGANAEDAEDGALGPKGQDNGDHEVGLTESNIQAIRSTAAEDRQWGDPNAFGTGHDANNFHPLDDGNYAYPLDGFGNRFNRRGGRKFGSASSHGRKISYDRHAPYIHEPQGQGVEGAPTGPKAMREGGSTLPRIRSTNSQAPDNINGQPEALNARERSKSASSHREPREKGDFGLPQSDTDRRHERSPRHKSDRDPPEHEKYDRPRRTRESSMSSSRRSASRSGNDKRHSSRSHHSSRHRHRHRRRSRSPDVLLDTELSTSEGKRKSKSDHRERNYSPEPYRKSSRKEKDRDRERERNRDRDRDRRKSRRDRSLSDGVKAEVDPKRSSRHSRSHRDHEKDRERRRDHGRDKESDRHREKPRRERQRDQDSIKDEDEKAVQSQRVEEPQLRIHGRSRENARKLSSVQIPPMNAPTGPRALQRNMTDSSDKPKESAAEKPEPAIDPFAQEREARMRERLLKEQQRRASLQQGPGIDRKRSFSETEEQAFAPPTGPSAFRNNRRKIQRDGDVSTATGREDRRKAKSYRQLSYHYEDEENDEARATRVETERESARWA
ncbi:hypothetical protein P152DRAFT_458470 [Eremomyces bilateralis CBS 781.70]|uniref:RING-type domain-containing protein n=1 Tax=Eremomyces bilateralis CBS 781.70 TaxID=1392243 RepID=A0A6G1G3H2_9PEZI|nr:uncharacterized protein P152DRAFT_458470 [Eremomyces bilateralis CBS 781.70]KAF1812655.1 hypothetical protein P152DRAFT_458470 [Eremomyces bilateralis CBS 781.70]